MKLRSSTYVKRHTENALRLKKLNTLQVYDMHANNLYQIFLKVLYIKTGHFNLVE